MGLDQNNGFFTSLTSASAIANNGMSVSVLLPALMSAVEHNY